ncbi:unnamed protein product [Mycena citricolor]|uniref:Glycoside hydrolase family 1 protein n=1 Tax=Mycena citricolor TaxID=2018698 RepID=A0AAD2HDW7_9AGAR|nr:unnamed protein product [Mycena citricolor]
MLESSLLLPVHNRLFLSYPLWPAFVLRPRRLLQGPAMLLYPALHFAISVLLFDFARAYIYPTSPMANSQLAPGKNVALRWKDNDKHPFISEMNAVRIDLCTPNGTVLHNLVQGVDPAVLHRVVHIPNTLSSGTFGVSTDGGSATQTAVEAVQTVDATNTQTQTQKADDEMTLVLPDATVVRSLLANPTMGASTTVVADPLPQVGGSAGRGERDRNRRGDGDSSGGGGWLAWLGGVVLLLSAPDQQRAPQFQAEGNAVAPNQQTPRPETRRRSARHNADEDTAKQKDTGVCLAEEMSHSRFYIGGSAESAGLWSSLSTQSIMSSSQNGDKVIRIKSTNSLVHPLSFHTLPHELIHYVIEHKRAETRQGVQIRETVAGKRVRARRDGREQCQHESDNRDHIIIDNIKLRHYGCNHGAQLPRAPCSRTAQWHLYNTASGRIICVFEIRLRHGHETVLQPLSKPAEIPARGWSASLSAAKTSIPASSAAHITSTISAPVSTITTNAPPVGSIPRDYSPAGLERLWDIVGSIEPPPFTTTRVPTSTKIQLPASPPPLYPSFFSPAPKDILPHLKFPPGFKFGIDTAAFQVEGAAKSEGKGPTMWDWCGHLPGCILDNSTGDIVDLQYFLYKEDVVRIAALGITAHSFSISWARIFPFGAADSPLNKQGLQHYSDLIDYHWEQGVEPVATLFHWDVPLALLADYGGFSSPKIVDDFVHYAKTVFKAYNGRIKTWYTFNEPRVFCAFFINPPFSSLLAPGVNASMAPYVCTYNLMKAHTATVKAFREMGISGEIGFKSDDFIGVPWRANSTEDALAVERHAAFRIGAFADPAYTTGDWPKILKDTLPPNYLPRFTPQEIKDNLGTADFFATDCYRSQYVVAPAEGIDACVANSSHPLWPECHDVVLFDSSNAGWAVGVSADPGSSWLQATPNTLRGLLKGLHTRWPSKKLYVSEFGISEPFESAWTDLFRITEDVARTNYYMTYLGEIMLSIHEDGVPISGAFAWAMLDNLEWNDGIRTKFGIQYVNYTTLERVYKRSAFALAEFFDAHLQK